MIRHHLMDGVPAPISPSSHATEADGFVFLTGQIARDFDDADRPLPAGIAAQTERSLGNLRIVLARIGLDLDDVLAVRVFLAEFRRDYDQMNAIYDRFFGTRARPCRTCIGVTALARGALIEIDCFAARGKAESDGVKALRTADRGVRGQTSLLEERS